MIFLYDSFIILIVDAAIRRTVNSRACSEVFDEVEFCWLIDFLSSWVGRSYD